MNTVTLISEYEARKIFRLPYFATRVPAGFPSPADDYMEGSLDLNEYLIRHPAATILCRVNGQSMEGLGILDGCLLVVDRAIQPIHEDIVLAVLDGEMTCKELDTQHQRLLSGNIAFPPIPISSETDFMIEGTVIHAINTYVRAGRL